MNKIKLALLALIFISVNTKCKDGLNAKNEIEQGIKSYNNKNYDEAFKLLSKNDSSTDFKADPQANFCLGVMYYTGQGVVQNYAEAIKWLALAAEKGNIEAAHDLGVIYQDGNNAVPQNIDEAIKWYRKAADEGYANSQLNLGIIYQEGKMVKQDYTEALKWYNKAAVQKSAGAQYNLALMYANGYGVEINEQEALRQLHLSANQGFEKAKELLKKIGIAD
jgi:TPR repeat protein